MPLVRSLSQDLIGPQLNADTQQLSQTDILSRWNDQTFRGKTTPTKLASIRGLIDSENRGAMAWRVEVEWWKVSSRQFRSGSFRSRHFFFHSVECGNGKFAIDSAVTVEFAFRFKAGSNSCCKGLGIPAQFAVLLSTGSDRLADRIPTISEHGEFSISGPLFQATEWNGSLEISFRLAKRKEKNPKPNLIPLRSAWSYGLNHHWRHQSWVQLDKSCGDGREAELDWTPSTQVKRSRSLGLERAEGTNDKTEQNDQTAENVDLGWAGFWDLSLGKQENNNNSIRGVTTDSSLQLLVGLTG